MALTYCEARDVVVSLDGACVCVWGGGGGGVYSCWILGIVGGAKEGGGRGGGNYVWLWV